MRRCAKRSTRTLFALWTGLIILLVVPWSSFQNHTHWERVAWVPFLSPPVRPGDILRNVLLYLPWGYFYARRRYDARLSWWAAICALALSAVTEATQLWSHARFPSLTDVTCNVAGAWIGGVWAALRPGAPQPPMERATDPLLAHDRRGQDED